MSQSGIKHLWKKQQVTHIVVHPTRSTGRIGIDYMVGDRCRYTENFNSVAMLRKHLRGQFSANGPYRHLSMADVQITSAAQAMMDAEDRNGVPADARDELRSVENLETFANVANITMWVVCGTGIVVALTRIMG